MILTALIIGALLLLLATAVVGMFLADATTNGGDAGEGALSTLVLVILVLCWIPMIFALMEATP